MESKKGIGRKPRTEEEGPPWFLILLPLRSLQVEGIGSKTLRLKELSLSSVGLLEPEFRKGGFPGSAQLPWRNYPELAVAEEPLKQNRKA